MHTVYDVIKEGNMVSLGTYYTGERRDIDGLEFRSLKKPDLTHVTEPLVSRSKLIEKIEGWFGSPEQFSTKVVQGTRFLVVDCLGYPYTVYCQQCQVFPYNQASFSLAAPFSSVLVLHNIAHTQGVGAWWRGWYSHLSLLIARPFIEAAILKLFNSRSSEENSSMKSLIAYLAMKSVGYIATIPLVAFTILEIVQNTAQKAYQGGLLEVIRDRNLILVDETHRLPYLYLILPTMLHGVAVDHLSIATTALINRVVPTPPTRTESDPLNLAMRSLWIAYLGSMLSDIILYPLKTVLVRLYCQGMPILVDNIENGVDLAFIQTYYRGFFDCIGGIFDSEGICGFYKGFSSLVIRYALHGALLFALWRTIKVVQSRYSGINR